VRRVPTAGDKTIQYTGWSKKWEHPAFCLF